MTRQFTNTTSLRIMFLLILLLPLKAYCFYNPGTGRWLSRDPLDEKSFLLFNRPLAGPISGVRNAPNYVFVRNDSTDLADCLGLFFVRGRAINVGRCEIAVVYGHGRADNPWRWKMSTSGCAAGAAVLCFPSSHIKGLTQNLWEEGESLEEPVWWLPPSDVDPVKSEPGVPRNSLNDINATVVFEDVLWRSLIRAREFCRKCCCVSIDVRFIRVRKDGSAVVDPPIGRSDDPSVPNWPSFRFNCATHAITFPF